MGNFRRDFKIRVPHFERDAESRRVCKKTRKNSAFINELLRAETLRDHQGMPGEDSNIGHNLMIHRRFLRFASDRYPQSYPPDKLGRKAFARNCKVAGASGASEGQPLVWLDSVAACRADAGGRKATFTAYSAKETMTIAELIQLHRSSQFFMERTAVLITPKPLRSETDRTPALLQLLWDRYGVLPRNLIFVEVTHRKVPYIRDDRYAVTVFDKEKDSGSIISVELSFGFMEEPNVERALEGMARLREIDLPIDRRQWIVHVSNENLLPAQSMRLIQRLRFRLFMLLRLVSRPAYYYYGLGDAVQLSAETLPVRVR